MEDDYPDIEPEEPLDPVFDNDLAFPELVDEENRRDAQELQLAMDEADMERTLRRRGWR
jgi:hypothetical protein